MAARGASVGDAAIATGRDSAAIDSAAAVR
jgi:hypothetical protein